MSNLDQLDGVIDEVQQQYHLAAIWPAMNSAHEGYAVLLEEVDELKAHVWTNQNKRNLTLMRYEALQVAAMAIRFVVDVCNEEKGRK